MFEWFPGFSSPVLQTILQQIYVSIDLQTTLSSCKINCQKWNYEVGECMFTFKFLIEMVRWLLQEKIVSYLLHASCSLLGAERNAKRMPEGLFPSSNFHLHCVPNPRECLGCLLGWVDLIQLSSLPCKHCAWCLGLVFHYIDSLGYQM